MLDILNIDDDPGILLDFTGQLRPLTESMRDIGCDEYTTGMITNLPLTLSDVGPEYLRGISSSLQSDIQEEMNDLIIFPNPAKNYIQVRFTPETKSKASLIIMDYLGQLVLNHPIAELHPKRFFSRQFDISSLKNGIYQVVLLEENRERTRKLIIQH